MTKENLQEKLMDLESQKEKMLANIQAVSGAIQMLKQLISEFENNDNKKDDVLE